MLEPQGTLFFLLLMVVFGALILWLVLTKQAVFRVLAACLAFIPAMVFGIAAVNKYYDYYQNWGALFADLSGQAPSVPQLSAAGLGGQTVHSLREQIGSSSDPALDAQLGYLFRTTITGARSHISRQVYIYLPPQYFSKTYATYRFPVIELLHGSPGMPTTWIDVLDVIPVFKQLLATGQASPAVLVMPDTEGGLKYSLQCLNDPHPHGVQDMTYVAQEVPAWIAANLRVQPPSLAWGIAGYSEGGFCAANIGLQYATRFGYVGVLSGYFAPDVSRVPQGGKPNGKPEDYFVFGRDKQLTGLNTPQEYVLHVPLGIMVPQFFLAAGAEDPADVHLAQVFRQLLLTRVADVPIVIIHGGGHQALVWRNALTPMFTWMTAGLTWQAQRARAPVTTGHPVVKPAPVRPPVKAIHPVSRPPG